MGRVGRTRIDVLLVRNGLVESSEQDERLIMAGQVLVNDRLVDKVGAEVYSDAMIRIRGRLAFASRGGVKLDAALDRFSLDVSGLVAADVGASTGGFTDCLLQRGATKVYAIDVGHGQLAWRLRCDPRVVVMERTNIRLLESLPEQVDLATVDTSFISLTLVLPVVRCLVRRSGQIVALVKPQFEAEREHVGRGGVVRDPEVHRTVLERICRWAIGNGLDVAGLVPSPLRGPAGNVEFFSLLRWRTTEPDTSEVEDGEGSRYAKAGHLIQACLSEVHGCAS